MDEIVKSLREDVTQQDQTESVDIFQNNDETLSYLSQKYDLEVNDELETCLEVAVNSEFKSGVLEYIAGYVGFKLAQKIDCQECLMLLKSEEKTPAIRSLISAKDKGGLFKPKNDLAKVCEVSEKIILEYIDQKQILNTSLTRLTCKIVTCLITQGSFPNQHQCALFLCSFSKQNILMTFKRSLYLMNVIYDKVLFLLKPDYINIFKIKCISIVI